MGLDDNDLAREEVRAIFVLGVIGSLLAIENALRGTKLSPNLSLHTLSYLLTGYWGLYVLLMAIGVSPDLIRVDVSTTCRHFANLYFVYGIGAIVSVPFVAAFDHCVTSPFGFPRGESIFIDGALAVIIASLVALKLKNRTDT